MKKYCWPILLITTLCAVSLSFFACSSSSLPKTVALQTISSIPPVLSLAHTKYVARTLASTVPQSGDVLASGACGGTITVKSYSKTGGNTSMALTFNNYCGKDSTSNGQVNIAGDFAFTSYSTSKSITANSPILAITSKNSSGTTLSSTQIGFTDLSLSLAGISSGTYGITIGELRAATTQGTTSRSIKITNVSASLSQSSGSSSTLAVSGRLYRAESGYTDIKTPVGQPFVLYSGSKLRSGSLELAGANSSNAVVTFHPGSPVTTSVTVNGTPLDMQLSCQNVSPSL